MKTAHSAGSGRFGRIRRGEMAFTLVETMVATALSVVIFGAILVTFSIQERCFIAALYQMDTQQDESRVMAYLSKDLRNATAIQLQAAGTQVTLTIPAQTAYSFNLNLGLSLLSLLSPPTSSSGSTTIVYYRQGSSILREVNGVSTCLTSSATQFSISQTGSLACINLGFQPRFCVVSNGSTSSGTQVTTYVYLLNSGQL
jgi:type II secretory pathway component PulJ